MAEFSADVRRDTELDTDIIRLEHTAPDGQVLIAEIAPEYGSNLYRLRYGEHELLAGDKDLLKQGEWTGTFVPWPIPNRVRDKEYEFEGQRHSLRGVNRIEGNDVLIHGLVDDRAWDYGQPSADTESASVSTSVDITPDNPAFNYYPFPSRLSLIYRLLENGIRVEYVVENQGEKNMPFGFALHPYFATLSGPEQTRVTLPANYIMEMDDELLPSGNLIPMGEQGYDLRQPAPVSKLHLDHVFTGLDPAVPPSIDYTALGFRLNLHSSPDFTHMVLYTEKAAEKHFICFENQTGSTDMINLHTRAVATNDERLKQAAHLLILGPGQKHQGYIEYQLQQTA